MQFFTENADEELSSRSNENLSVGSQCNVRKEAAIRDIRRCYAQFAKRQITRPVSVKLQQLHLVGYAIIERCTRWCRRPYDEATVRQNDQCVVADSKIIDNCIARTRPAETAVDRSIAVDASDKQTAVKIRVE